VLYVPVDHFMVAGIIYMKFPKNSMIYRLFPYFGV
jgi:hypothetical protein